MTKVHISLRVEDVGRSKTFYEAFFGVPAHKVRPGYVNFDLDEPPLKLALNQLPAEGKGSLDHLGFVVESREAVQAFRDRMAASGLTTFSEEEVTCCYATQDKVWVTDPDGHSWEVYVLLDELEGVDFGGKPMIMAPQFIKLDGPGCCEG